MPDVDTRARALANARAHTQRRYKIVERGLTARMGSFRRGRTGTAGWEAAAATAPPPSADAAPAPTPDAERESFLTETHALFRDCYLAPVRAGQRKTRMLWKYSVGFGIRR